MHHFTRVEVSPGVVLGWGGVLAEWGYTAEVGSRWCPYLTAPVEMEGSNERRSEILDERRDDAEWQFGCPISVW